MSNEDFFLGRKNQVKSITDFLNSNKNNAALVYGRRRVGKTELLKQNKDLEKNTFVDVVVDSIIEKGDNSEVRASQQIR